MIALKIILKETVAFRHFAGTSVQMLHLTQKTEAKNFRIFSCYNLSLVNKKFISCKILQVSCEKVQFLQDSWMQWLSCKILARNCALSQEGKSCKNLGRFVQEFVLYHKNLARNNHLYTHYVLIIYAFHQKASIINR